MERPLLDALLNGEVEMKHQISAVFSFGIQNVQTDFGQFKLVKWD